MSGALLPLTRTWSWDSNSPVPFHLMVMPVHFSKSLNESSKRFASMSRIEEKISTVLPWNLP